MANQSPNNFPASTLPLKSSDIFAVNQTAPQDPNVAKQTTLGDINPDSGWLDLSGFNFISGQTFRPQYRVIGRVVHFRGSALVQLGSGGGVTPVAYISEANYTAQLFTTPYTGVVQGVVINPAGSLTFNNGSPVLPFSLDSSYASNKVIMARRIKTNGGDTEQAVYYGTVDVNISSTGVLLLDCLLDNEDFATGTTVGSSSLRFINSNVVAGQSILDLRNAGAGSSTLLGSSAGTPYTYAITEIAHTHAITLDAGSPGSLGGFGISLSGLVAYLPPLV